jgi:hypothetical protein
VKTRPQDVDTYREIKKLDQLGDEYNAFQLKKDMKFNMRQRVSKEPLPLIFVNLEAKDNNKEI